MPPKCYTDEWQRTEPDYVIHLPEKPGSEDEYADHIHTFFTPGGDLMTIWTQATYESAPNMRTVYSRSVDGGHTWATCRDMATPPAPNMCTTQGFPIVSQSGRIYCIYMPHPGFGEGQLWSGPLHVKYSDDDGRTWIDSGVDIPFRRTRFDHPDAKIHPTCIVWQQPLRDGLGRWIAGFTRWSSHMVYPRPLGGNRNHADSQCELMRFENIDDGPDPRDIEITFLLDEEGTIRVSCGIEPDASTGYSLAEEPGIAVLPDGRLWMNMRTVTGRIWYTVSNDHGHSWRPPEVLRYQDGGDEVLHPKSPDPIYRLQDGRYLLFFSNRDGWDRGDTGPWDMAARRPMCITVGAFRPDAHQPIWFSEPKLLMDTQRVKTGVVNLDWLAMYSSLTEHDGERVFWYADRKTFVLGKRIDDEFLAGLEAP